MLGLGLGTQSHTRSKWCKESPIALGSFKEHILFLFFKLWDLSSSYEVCRVLKWFWVSHTSERFSYAQPQFRWFGALKSVWGELFKAPKFMPKLLQEPPVPSENIFICRCVLDFVGGFVLLWLLTSVSWWYCLMFYIRLVQLYFVSCLENICLKRRIKLYK